MEPPGAPAVRPAAVIPAAVFGGAGELQQAFDEQIKVPVPSRGATFNVHVSGRAHLSRGLVYLLHGAGFTGQSWAPLVAHMRGQCACAAPDLRAHGLTVTDDDADMSVDTLVGDAVALLQALLQPGGALSGASQPHPQHGEQHNHQQQQQGAVSVLAVGHSLGGAIAIRAAVAQRSPPSADPSDAGAAATAPAEAAVPGLIAGVVCIDVAEGTALASLPHMEAVIAAMPQSFPSIDDAITWHIKTGAIRNAVAARVTVPSRLVQRTCGCGAEAVPAAAARGSRAGSDSGGGAAEAGGATSGDGGTEWVWRTDLARTAQFWEGWFLGLSSAFINLKIPKLLIVAGMDRLDTELTVGQIQGKYQLKLVYGAGHSVHEDQPSQVASHVLSFARHFGVLRDGGGAGGGGDGGREKEAEELRRKLERARALAKQAQAQAPPPPAAAAQAPAAGAGAAATASAPQPPP